MDQPVDVATSLRCDFKVSQFSAQVSAELSKLATRPSVLDFRRRQLEVTLDRVRQIVELAKQAQLEPFRTPAGPSAAVLNQARADPSYLREQEQIRNLEQELEKLRSELRVYTGEYKGLIEGVKSQFYRVLGKTPQDPVQRDMAAEIEKRKVELDYLKQQSELRLKESLALTTLRVRQELESKQRDLEQLLGEFRFRVEMFATSVDRLAETISREAAKLVEYGSYLQSEVDRLCAKFNEDELQFPELLKKSSSVVTPVPPKVEYVVQKSQNFISEVQKLLTAGTSGRADPFEAWNLRPEETRCSDKKTETEPSPYQRAWAELGSYHIKDGRFVIDWLPGTGKSCLGTLLMPKQILSVAEHIEISSKTGQGLPQGFPQVPVPILVFLYSPGEFSKYRSAQSEQFCSLQRWNELIQTEVEERKDVIITTFRLKPAMTIMAVARIQKFTVKPEGVGNSAMRELFPGKESLPRPGGLIIVDEVHYMFAPTEISSHKNHASLYLSEMVELRDVKIFMLTGTPTAHSGKFENYFRLAAFLDAA